MTKTAKLGTLSLIASALLVGCGGGSTADSSVATSTGYFIDAAVEGVTYETTSGISGTTDATGKFQYRNGDQVKLHIGNLILGETTPTEEGLVTPETLSHGDEELKTLLLRMLQSIDSDNNTSNGITIPENIDEVLSSINTTTMETLNEEELLLLDTELAAHLDEDFDGHIDTNETEAQTHFEHSMGLWDEGTRPDSEDMNQSFNGNGNQNGQDNGHNGQSQEGNSTQTPIDVNTLPLSTLTEDLKNAIAYMGNEERLAYDVYMNLYEYHNSNNAENINQLQNIANRAEITHVGIVQSLVQKYNLTVEDLTNVTDPIADNTVAFEDMPKGEYDIPAIQSLYDTLYAKGIQSKEDALMVGCMVEVTDINDLDEYITLAEESNATDVKEAFEVLRDGSYSHYWAFDKGLKNIGISDGCYVEGDALLGENKEDIYPQNDNGGNDHN